MFVDEALSAYVAAHSTSPDKIQRKLITATADLGDVSSMQIGVAQGAFMSLLVTVLQPKLAVEVGTFTGYSALAVARALPPGGRLLCCDLSDEWTVIARKHWQLAGVDDLIDLHIGPAIDTLRSLPFHPQIDFAFVDADKEGNIDYYEEILSRLSAHGVILVDNALWGGDVAKPECTDTETDAVRSFNTHVISDPRVIVAILPVGDGLSMITHVPQ